MKTISINELKSRNSDMPRDILHRHNGAILASGETARAAAESARAGLGSANLSSADLIGANLSSADLIGANLSRADLCGANLSGADLRDANLSGANLSGANLSYAYLSGVDLSGANLRGANLRDANLRDANLSGANLRYAYLSGADLSGANLRGANLRGADLRDVNLSNVNLSDTDLRNATFPCVVPVIPDIDAAILAAIEVPGCALKMSRYHSCGTTHCRAGWAIHLAGKAGYALEKVVGSSVAGALIYAASRPDRCVPDFYASNDDALADLRKGLVRTG